MLWPLVHAQHVECVVLGRHQTNLSVASRFLSHHVDLYELCRVKTNQLAVLTVKSNLGK